MKVTKVNAGEYKAETTIGTYYVVKLYSAETCKAYGWDIYTGSIADCNAWAWVLDTKRECIEALQEMENESFRLPKI